MDDPLWTDAYAPSLADLPQSAPRDRLQRSIGEPMNLLLQGPPGVGKTAAARALARDIHNDPESDLIEINVADFFSRTKKELRADPRFESFLSGRSGMAKADMINHVLTESASHAPVAGSFKTILLDNAEAIREDFQQALRRVMEQHHRTTQFIFTTRQPAKLIAPIQSRCFPVPIRAPTTDEMMTVLASICASEGVDYDESGLEYVASAADGNLRTAVLTAQTTVAQTDELRMQTAYETLGDIGDDDAIRGILIAVSNGEFAEARGTVDELLTDEGYDGTTLLESLLRVARSQSEFDSDDVARLHTLAGAADHELTEGLDDRLHLLHLLTAWADGRTELRAMA